MEPKPRSLFLLGVTVAAVILSACGASSTNAPSMPLPSQPILVDPTDSDCYGGWTVGAAEYSGSEITGYSPLKVSKALTYDQYLGDAGQINSTLVRLELPVTSPAGALVLSTVDGASVIECMGKKTEPNNDGWKAVGTVKHPIINKDGNPVGTEGMKQFKIVTLKDQELLSQSKQKTPEKASSTPVVQPTIVRSGSQMAPTPITERDKMGGPAAVAPSSLSDKKQICTEGGLCYFKEPKCESGIALGYKDYFMSRTDENPTGTVPDCYKEIVDCPYPSAVEKTKKQEVKGLADGEFLWAAPKALFPSDAVLSGGVKDPGVTSVDPNPDSNNFIPYTLRIGSDNQFHVEIDGQNQVFGNVSRDMVVYQYGSTLAYVFLGAATQKQADGSTKLYKNVIVVNGTQSLNCLR